MNPADTIAAVSSPPGRSWRGMIRVAGPEAWRVTAPLLDDPPALESHRVTHARLCDPALPVLLTFFRGLRSYCGDDTIELQMPGHPAVLERVLQQCFAAGARAANPGEFTYRAWKHGKLDLLEAEGVAALIAARSDGQLAAAQRLHGRELGRHADSLTATLTDLLALVEAGIDFTDQEDVVPIEPRLLHERLSALHESVETLRSRSQTWGQAEALPRVVLAGPPSAGKSTLFNALLGRRRAVADPLPGTTRDVIEEPWEVSPGREVLLVDLAGLDDAAAGLDAQAQALAREAIADADLVLWLGNAGLAPTGALAVQSRCDLDVDNAKADVRVSGVTGEGLQQLRQRLVERLDSAGCTTAGDALVLQPRHTEALRQAASSIDAARSAFDADGHALTTPELVAVHLRAALDALGTLSGRVDPDDVIGRVFATFCVGK